MLHKIGPSGLGWLLQPLHCLAMARKPPKYVPQTLSLLELSSEDAEFISLTSVMACPQNKIFKFLI